MKTFKDQQGHLKKFSRREVRLKNHMQSYQVTEKTYLIYHLPLQIMFKACLLGSKAHIFDLLGTKLRQLKQEAQHG